MHRRAGDALGLGNALRIAARLAWLDGDVELAEARANEAVEVLREQADSWQYAMALSGLSQLDMLAERGDLAHARSTEAMERADRIGRSDIYLHALTNRLAITGDYDYDTHRRAILDGLAEARRRGVPDMLPRMYVNLTFQMMSRRRYEDLFEQLDAGIAAATDRDHLAMEGYMRGTRALALVDVGRLAEAQAEAESVVHGPYPRGVTRFTSVVAAARARVRQGQGGLELMDELRDMPITRRDVMRRAPIAITDAECAWLMAGDLSRATENLRAAFDLACRTPGLPWDTSDTTLWLLILGEPVCVPEAAADRLTPPVRHMLAGRWRDAAAEWERIGCPYERAICLSRADEAGQRAALALFDGIGAAPAAANLRRQMRADGVRDVPRGRMRRRVRIRWASPRGNRT